jgi:hypothetical protein
MLYCANLKQMPGAPVFFVPMISQADQEAAYAALAQFCSCSVPSVERRIYSITFIHDAEEWVATVGQNLTGTSRRRVRSKGKTIEKVTGLSDPAVVLAIFPGNTYVVATNARPPQSQWENPFFAGGPRSITYFAHP